MAKSEIMASHASRRASAWRKSPVNYCMLYDEIRQEDTIENDRVVKKTVLKTVRPDELHAGLKASDFYLENVIAAGALSNLKEVHYTDVTHEVIDELNGSVDQLMNVIDAQAGAEMIQNEKENE